MNQINVIWILRINKKTISESIKWKSLEQNNGIKWNDNKR